MFLEPDHVPRSARHDRRWVWRRQEGRRESLDPPQRVAVLPVFFVPQGESSPTEDQAIRLHDYLRWCQARYRELLGGKDTFLIAQEAPLIYDSKRPLAELKRLPEDAAPQIVSES